MNRWLFQTVARSILRGAMAGPREQESPSSDESAKPAPALVVISARKDIVAGYRDRARGHSMAHAAFFHVHKGTLGDKRVTLAWVPAGESLGRATEAMITAHRPSLVVAADFGVALDASLAGNDLVLANRIVTEQNETVRVDVKRPGHPGTHVGTLLCADTLPASPEARRQCGDRFQAIACDTVSYPVADACRREGVPMVSVVVIAAALYDRTPKDLAHLDAQSTLAGRAGALAGSLFRRPSSMKDMWGRQQSRWDAAERLLDFLANT